MCSKTLNTTLRSSYTLIDITQYQYTLINITLLFQPMAPPG